MYLLNEQSARRDYGDGVTMGIENFGQLTLEWKQGGDKSPHSKCTPDGNDFWSASTYRSFDQAYSPIPVRRAHC